MSNDHGFHHTQFSSTGVYQAPSVGGDMAQVGVDELLKDVDAVASAQQTRAERERIKNAVYAHIRAVRALGRTKINTAEIAGALSLSVRDVDLAVKALRAKGVSRAK